MHMVDWNLDSDGFVSDHDKTPTPMLVKQPNRRGPFGLRKSRPLVEGSQDYITHSGRRRLKLPTKVRRAKRDSDGQVTRQSQEIFRK